MDQPQNFMNFIQVYSGPMFTTVPDMYQFINAAEAQNITRYVILQCPEAEFDKIELNLLPVRGRSVFCYSPAEKTKLTAYRDGLEIKFRGSFNSSFAL